VIEPDSLKSVIDDPMKDPLVKSIIKSNQIPEKQTMIEGTYFKDAFFPEKTLAALI
jgi:hypothetical protein